MIFVDNHADSGGAVYIEDSMALSCPSSGIECFIQSVTINKKLSDATNIKPIIFRSNTATNSMDQIYLEGYLIDALQIKI